MSFYDGNLNHLAPPKASAGPTSSFVENFSAMYDRQYKVDSMYSLEGELENAYNANIAQVKELTGEDLSLPAQQGLNIFSAVADRKLGRATWGGEIFGADLRNQRLAEFDQREARLLELKKQYPDIKSFDELLEGVQKVRNETMQQAETAGSTAGLAGGLGGFAGSVAGSFTFRDPLLVASLFVGGWGSTVAKRMLTEAGVGMVTEGVQQFGYTQPTQRALQEEGTNPWASILFAGVGAGAFRGAVEGVAPAYRALERSINPNTARARTLATALDGAEMNDALIGRMFERAPDTPSTRAARHAFDADKALRDNAPDGKSNMSSRDFMAEMQRTSDIFDGVRIAASQVPDYHARPAFMEEVNFNRALLHSENPALVNRLDDIGARVTAADARVAQITNAIETRTVGDAVRLVDEVTGDRVKAIEADMQKTGANVAALERELDTIIESIGPDQIAKAEKDWRIGPRRQLADARSSARAAQREYNKVAKEVDGHIAAMKSRHAAEQAVREQIAAKVPEGIRPTQRVSVGDGQLAATVPTKAVEHAEAVKVAAEKIPEVAEAVVSAPRVEGKIDVGLEHLLDENFQIPVGMNEKGEAIVRTVKQIMEELDEDRAMVEAMRGCAI